MKYFEHSNAASLEEASQSLIGGAKAIAGGTDILGVLKDKILPEYPANIVNLKTIPNMDGIKETDDGLTIGANATLADIADSDIVKNGYAALARAAYSVASPLIRNRATIGGNLCQDTRCWYYRYPHQIGGRVVCARKGGESCYAFTGEHKYHSIFGGMRVHSTACSKSCPAHVDIPQYQERIRANDIDGAAEILLRKNPLAAMTARVCTHFCMEACHREDYDAAVNIGQIERYVGDYILNNAERLMPPPKNESGKSVAIIGAGPAALTAAYYLRREGHSVTIIDKMDEPGGLLMYAIPEYRLPKAKVRQLTKAIAGMGVIFKQNTQVGEDIGLGDVIERYDSVFLDTGAWKRNVIGIDGEELTVFGLEFLVEVKTWMKDKPGSDVIVVGGGNVAVDVAVTAKRLGAGAVTMVSLETEDQLPATKEEMDRALEEGIVHLGGFGPKAVLKQDGAVKGIEFKRCMRLRDETGRFSPLYDESDIRVIDGDAILLAVGQQIDLSYLDERLDVKTGRGRISVEEASQATTRSGVFAGGDVTTGPSTVVSAIAAGHSAANSMNEYLTGLSPIAKTQETFVKRGSNCLEHSKPAVANLRPKEQRSADLEDDLGLSFEVVSAEANRCFNCACFAVNPSDIAAALMSLRATVHTNMGSFFADDFFTKATRISDMLRPGEIVTRVEIPKQSGVSAYDKFRERKAIDFAMVSVASVYETEDGVIRNASIVLGAVAPVPIRARNAEIYLVGKKADEETAARAAEIALEEADPLAQNAYKIQIAKTLVKRSLLNGDL
jgi:NADPH-dependent glutamate synthase beta subunit-like oxidoreductase